MSVKYIISLIYNIFEPKSVSGNLRSLFDKKAILPVPKIAFLPDAFREWLGAPPSIEVLHNSRRGRATHKNQGFISGELLKYVRTNEYKDHQFFRQGKIGGY
jgi:hypothetical protein